jgi:hypothetical protein
MTLKLLGDAPRRIQPSWGLTAGECPLFGSAIVRAATGVVKRGCHPIAAAAAPAPGEVDDASDVTPNRFEHFRTLLLEERTTAEARMSVRADLIPRR